MSETPVNDQSIADPLSALLRRLKLSARVFLRADFCGDWAVDTSGDRRAPFHLVTRGTGWLHTPGEPPQPMTAGDLVVFPHDAPHTLSHSAAAPAGTALNQPMLDSGSPAEPVTSLLCGYFAFDGRAAAPLLDGLPDVMVLHLGDAARHGSTGMLVHLWMAEAAGAAPGVDAAIDQLAYVVLIHVLREQLARGRIRGPLQALTDPRIGPALNAIHADPGAVISIDALAAEAAMSRSAFAERFKRHVGLTPGRYLSHWRMQLAVELLTDTDLPVAHIAERCGYESEAAFRKAFRRSVGSPPGRVRKGHE